VSRGEARALQKRATVLVNPRMPTDDFTRYSFPSKTMEYMASGRPVLMHALPGMPEEYLPHFVQPATTDVKGLASAMEDMSGWEASRLVAFGVKARNFVLQEKNAVIQCRKIVDLISSDR
jgi:glycosyltransferase involved in cell wall biosynthesis